VRRQYAGVLSVCCVRRRHLVHEHQRPLVAVVDVFVHGLRDALPLHLLPPLAQVVVPQLVAARQGGKEDGGGWIMQRLCKRFVNKSQSQEDKIELLVPGCIAIQYNNLVDRTHPFPAGSLLKELFNLMVQYMYDTNICNNIYINIYIQ